MLSWSCKESGARLRNSGGSSKYGDRRIALARTGNLSKGCCGRLRLVDSGQSLVDAGRFGPERCKCRPQMALVDVDQNWPMLEHKCQKRSYLDKIGPQKLANVDHYWSKLAKVWLASTNMWPKSVNVGLTLQDSGQCWPASVKLWSKSLGRTWAKCQLPEQFFGNSCWGPAQ